MFNKYMYYTLFAALPFTGAGNQVSANETTLKIQDDTAVEVSIYNQNLALIKDSRQVDLGIGRADVAFEGVASQMMPETAVINANGVKILEQNYEYDLLTPENILEESIGQEVTTVITNPETGKNVFDKATIINSNYGRPILKFSYGIESNFPGRLVYKDLPQNLRVKPTLAVALENVEAGGKTLNLTYLTQGLSWQANYVAELTADTTMDLQGWVTLNNQSGADYKNASVKLIAGEVNNVSAPRPVQMRQNLMMAKATGIMAADTAIQERASLTAENLSEYYVYRLPQKTDIMDKQSKQVSLMDIKDVSFAKKYKLTSPLYLSLGSQDASFENAHPQLIYTLKNNEESHLGMPLPAGIIRFYNKDDSGASEFTGSANIRQLAKGETAELTVGQAFDVYANGQVKKMQKLSDKVFEAEVEVVFHNAKEAPQTVVFEQNFYASVDVISENMPSKSDKVRQLVWNVEVPGSEKTVLNFKVRMTRN